MRRLTSMCRPCPPPGRKPAKRRPQRKAKTKTLRRPRAQAVRQLERAGIAALAVLLLAGGLTWLLRGGWPERQAEALAADLYQASADLGLAVEEVLVEGRVRSARSALLGALALERGDPILGFDPHAAKARLEGLPWVRRATIERRLPSLVYLSLEERRPIALWQLDGVLAVIDEQGTVIAGARAQDFAELTIVVGPDAPQHTAALLHLLDSEPDLRRQVVAAVRVGDRRWNLRLAGDIDVRLPETGTAEAWSQFARIERQHGVLQRDVDSIDLRQPDRFVVRSAPDEGERAVDDDGKNT